MAHFDDLPLASVETRDVPPPPPGPPPAPPAPPRSVSPAIPILAGVFLVAAAAALWWNFAHRRGAVAGPPPKTVSQTSVDLPPVSGARVAEPGEAIDLPPLAETDGLIRMLIGRLSSHPTIAAWLTTDQLLRNAAVVVTNIAAGETPAKHLQRIRPSGDFAVRQSGGLTWIDPAGYSRYDRIAAAVDGLDGRGVARFYATVKPRLEEASLELAPAEPSLDRTVERAIVVLLRTPIVVRDIQLRTEKVSYAFADPALEGLSQAQRQFLRMGPRNMRLVKGKLREVAGYLGIPDSALPPPGDY
jgi:hypothetical protein